MTYCSFTSPADFFNRLSTSRELGEQGQRQSFLCDHNVFGLGETLATTLTGLATRIAAKIAAYTYAFLVNRLLGRPQGRIKELWA